MSDPEITLPPRRPNTPRVWIARSLDWLKAHPEHAIRGGIFLGGFVLGAVIF